MTMKPRDEPRKMKTPEKRHERKVRTTPAKTKELVLPFPGAVFDTRTQNDLGNVFAWLGGTTKALRRAGATDEQIEEFKAEATSGDYENAIRVCHRWVEVR